LLSKSKEVFYEKDSCNYNSLACHFLYRLLCYLYAVTESGKKVVLYDNGTLEYVVAEEFSPHDLPLKIIKAGLVSDYYSSYEDAKIPVKNVSNKTIKAFALTFVLFNGFGDEVDQLYNRYIAQELRLSPGKEYTAT